MGGSGRKRDRDDRAKHGRSQGDTSSEADTAPKKLKKHKHKRTKEKLLKKEKHMSSESPSLLDDCINDDQDLLLEDREQQQQAMLVQDRLLHPSHSDHMQLTDHANMLLNMSKKSEHSRSKKNKKKDKNRDREGKSNKKEKKSSRKESKLEAESKGEKKESRGGEKKSCSSSNKEEDGTDSEEERWLHAIEAGRLEEVDDELKRIRNPRLLTARQRALLEKQRTDEDLLAVPVTADLLHEQGDDGLQLQHTDVEQQIQPQAMPIIPPEPLLALPSGFKEKVVTQEMLEKKAIKSQRRRAQALEKREEDKKKTVDRLLKKQDSKLLKPGYNKKVVKAEVAMFSYRNDINGVRISLPPGTDYPIGPQKSLEKPPVRVCGVGGCGNPKRYSCSKTGVPLCSLQCYRANLNSILLAAPIC